jgi:Transglycosylase SLT domain
MTRSSDMFALWRNNTTGTLRKSARWAWQGIVDIGHNSLAVLGLACIGIVLFFSSDSALRHQLERHALEWLNLRHGAPTAAADDSNNVLAGMAEPEAVDRATARHLKGLPRNQALVATWLARRYRVAPEAVARLVQEAWHVGNKAKVEPTLILAIMAIESSFNPFAQSSVGAQGLMQVMTQVHDDKYAAFGGTLAAFDPLTNLRVGVQVLRDCMTRAGGDVELGLKYYVGAANLPTDGGYADKVLGEQAALLQVASGGNVQPTAYTVRAASAVATAVAALDLPARKTPVVAAKGLQDALPSTSFPVAQNSSVAPAAHAAAGTIMAPAVGAALAVNLSALPAASSSPEAATAAPAARPANEAKKPVLPEPVAPAVQPKTDVKPAAVSVLSSKPAADGTGSTNGHVVAAADGVR